MAFGDEAWAILLADLEPAFAPAFLSVLAVALGLEPVASSLSE